MFVDNFKLWFFFSNKNERIIHIWKELKIIYKPDHVLSFFEWILIVASTRLDWECEEINCVKKHKQWISSESSDVLNVENCSKWENKLFHCNLSIGCMSLSFLLRYCTSHRTIDHVSNSFIEPTTSTEKYKKRQQNCDTLKLL